MTVKLFLDDVREAPEGFMLLRPNVLAIFYFLARHADVISMDHDLGNEYPTGYDILQELEKHYFNQEIWQTKIPEIIVHSANPVGKANMQRVIDNIYRMSRRHV